MSVSARQWAWNVTHLRRPEQKGHSRISSGEKLVLLALGELENEDYGYAFPSIATIARRCAMGERTVERHLRTLRESGVVQVKRGERRRSGKWLQNVYILDVPAKYREADPRWVGRQADTGVTEYHGHPDADDVVWADDELDRRYADATPF